MTSQVQKDVPALAWLEEEILSDAISRGALSASTRMVEKRYSLPEGFLGTGISKQTKVLRLLFLVLVFPRELVSPRKDRKNDRSFAERLGESYDINNFSQR